MLPDTTLPGENLGRMLGVVTLQMCPDTRTCAGGLSLQAASSQLCQRSAVVNNQGITMVTWQCQDSLILACLLQSGPGTQGPAH